MLIRLRTCVLCLTLLVAVSCAPLPASRDKRQDDSQEQSRASAELSMNTGEEFFEGDIVIDLPSSLGQVTQEEEEDGVYKREAKAEDPKVTVSPTQASEGYKNRTDLWEGGKVPFKFETDMSPMYRDRFIVAMEMWTLATDHCITFSPASPDEKDYVLFRVDEKSGCSSRVGRYGGEQLVNISSGCSGVGNAAHEIGHALGLWHEHSRPDRDEYIEVLHENIIPKYSKNFAKGTWDWSKNPPVSYDIESIMHYGPRAFGEVIDKHNTKVTIRARENATWDMCDDLTQMGQRERISYKDVLRVKMLYGCGNVTPTDMPRGCDKPKTTPTPTPTLTTSAPVTTPTPTLTNKLQTNDVITLQMGNNEFGMRCVPSPGCTPTPCHVSIFGNANHCTNVENQFKIIRPGSTRIAIGDRVLLRSVSKPSMWLNCSGLNRECKITQCTSNAADPSNSSYISECEEHFFTIKQGKRGQGKVATVKRPVQLKSFWNDSYLTCVGKKCEMVDSGVCPTPHPSRAHLLENNDGVCTIQSFNVTKLREGTS